MSPNLRVDYLFYHLRKNYESGVNNRTVVSIFITHCIMSNKSKSYSNQLLHYVVFNSRSLYFYYSIFYVDPRTVSCYMSSTRRNDERWINASSNGNINVAMEILQTNDHYRRRLFFTVKCLDGSGTVPNYCSILLALSLSFFSN